jgi:O-acetylserine/cysteine efflux transporter
MVLRPVDYAMGVAVPFTWSMGFVYAKVAIDHFPPIFLMAMRFTIAAIVLVWFAQMPRGMLRRIAAISFVSAAVQYSLIFTGLKGLDASVAAIVVQLEVPFMVLLGVLLLRETAGLRKWIGIAMAFAGVGLIAGEPRVGGAWVSLFMVLAASFIWALGQIMVRSTKGVDGLTMTAWISVFAAPQLLLLSLIFETGQRTSILTATPIDWGAVAYLGLVMTAIGYGLWNSLLRRHPVSAVAPFLLLMPVFSIVGAVIFLGDKLTRNVLLGGLIVLVGVAIILFGRSSSALLNAQEAD